MSETLSDRLNAALRDAMKARNKSAVAALRSALAAIANAESVARQTDPTPAATSEHVAGSVAGLRAAEVERRDLRPEEVDEIVRAEIDDRREAADHYRRAGQDDMADQLEREAGVLAPFVGGS